MLQCPKCGNKTKPSVNSRFCDICGSPLFDQTEIHPAPLTRPKGVPWENPEGKSIFAVLFMTVKQCLMEPSIFFERLSTSRNSFMAWLYALILGSVGSIFNFIWTFLIISPLLSLVPGLEAFSGKSSLTTFNLVFSPLIITIKLFWLTCYFHLLLFLTGSKRQNTSSTFRVLCYTQSTSILDCIPVLGAVISLLWSINLLVVGFTKVHKITMFRAIMIIVLLPVIFLIIAGIITALLFGTGIIVLDAFKDYLSIFR